MLGLFLFALHLVSVGCRPQSEQVPSAKGAVGVLIPQEEPLFKRWLKFNETDTFEDGWSDDGYDPSRSKLTRDTQLLFAMNYGKSVIDNGGFFQFFDGSCGVFAPEMLEWCSRNQLDDVAKVLQEAMVYFGPEYPRSTALRHRLLDLIPENGERNEWDPFYELDNRFFAILSNNGSRYYQAADRWMHEQCGVQDERDSAK